MSRGLRDFNTVIGAALILLGASLSPSRAQTALTTDTMITQLSGLDTPPDIDVAALRQQVVDRIKAKADGIALKRPPVAAQLLKLPQLMVEIQFDPDSPVIRPPSYQTIGRIADALYDPSLLPYTFLVVGHNDATGRREISLALSQRRADSIRDVLVNTFKVSPKRIRAIGLGEEQLQDSVHPTAAINRQIQVMAVGKME
jgi:outer membrane protein OmpA-like peptidoglycan-associated protein